MDGRWVSDDGVDATLAKVPPKGIAPLRADLKQVIGVGFTRGLCLKSNRQPAEPLSIPPRGRPAGLVPFLEAWQFPRQNPSLHPVQLGVEPHHHVIVLAHLAQLALASNCFVQLGALRYHRATIASGGQILARVEAEAA